MEPALFKYLNEGIYNHITFTFPGNVAFNRTLILLYSINEYS